jgi:Raf kinase inhibitor-like YbhB/YbcL family protein
MSLKITSKAFANGEMIPSKYTCDGPNTSPALTWSGLPEGTKELALIVDDPDAPSGLFVHWVIYHISPTITELEEGIPPAETLPNGARQGTNGFHKIGYGGPCPPSGTHRYFFHLYALNTQLALHAGASRADFDAAMSGHTLEKAELMGRYKKK